LTDKSRDCNANSNGNSNQPAASRLAFIRLLGVFRKVPFNFAIDSVNFAIDGVESGIEDFALLSKTFAYIFTQQVQYIHVGYPVVVVVLPQRCHATLFPVNVGI